MKSNTSATKKLGQKIAEVRNQKGLTQETLAANTHLNRAYIGYIERGERNPSIETVDKIAKTLGVKLYELFIFND